MPSSLCIRYCSILLPLSLSLVGHLGFLTSRQTADAATASRRTDGRTDRHVSVFAVASNFVLISLSHASAHERVWVVGGRSPWRVEAVEGGMGEGGELGRRLKKRGEEQTSKDSLLPPSSPIRTRAGQTKGKRKQSFLERRERGEKWWKKWRERQTRFVGSF